ncbi:hypothetical protein TRFO_36157 [Tritrichomonas foetus]|uniref:Glycosyltransferase 2-like domain-containing protein n=1 Tax=Tritrichomonas foetus TaxID=1144522 RepID=A0A1J4JJ52_9EUKA|nr:hypothetical protein TRFO_36157 [Tritrichomonas foetus]|eukprot:OHS97587.1 hypothetical protein TRFO_36157 [Tritrichomonas foetus]
MIFFHLWYLFIFFRFLYFSIRQYQKDFKKIVVIYNVRIDFFSVVIPIYNKEKYLQKCFSSLSSQTFQNFEVIAVNDFSSDNSSRVIDQMKFSHLKMISHSTNKGLLNSRVTGVKSSSGLYIVSLDPDDELVPTILQSLHNILKTVKYDIVEYQSFFYNQQTHKKTPMCMIPAKFKKINNSNLLRLATKKKIYPCLWRKCIKKIIYLKGLSLIPDDIFNLNITTAEDVIQTFSIFLFCKSYLVIPTFGYVYHIGLNDSSGKCTYYSCKEMKKQERIAFTFIHHLYLMKKNISFPM